MNSAPAGSSAGGNAAPARAPAPDALLTGELPCVTCGYQLKGLSVRDVCPECGTAVRATILHAVDPLADELAPMRAPSTTGVLIVVWALSAALGIWAMLFMRGIDALRALNVRVEEAWWAWNVGLVLLVVSAVGSLGFLAPTRRTKRRAVACAALATLAYLPLFVAMVNIRALDLQRGGSGAAFFTTDPEPDRILWRLLLGASLIVVFLGVRPNARELVRRCVALRTGRVDRQTLAAMAGASAVAMLGDTLRLVGSALATPVREPLVIAGSMTILIATVFLGLGMISATVDGLRIRSSLRLGPKRLSDIVDDAAPA